MPPRFRLKFVYRNLQRDLITRSYGEVNHLTGRLFIEALLGANLANRDLTGSPSRLGIDSVMPHRVKYLKFSR